MRKSAVHIFMSFTLVANLAFAKIVVLDTTNVGPYGQQHMFSMDLSTTEKFLGISPGDYAIIRLHSPGSQQSVVVEGQVEKLDQIPGHIPAIDWNGSPQVYLTNETENSTSDSSVSNRNSAAGLEIPDSSFIGSSQTGSSNMDLVRELLDDTFGKQMAIGGRPSPFFNPLNKTILPTNCLNGKVDCSQFNAERYYLGGAVEQLGQHTKVVATTYLSYYGASIGEIINGQYAKGLFDFSDAIQVNSFIHEVFEPIINFESNLAQDEISYQSLKRVQLLNQAKLFAEMPIDTAGISFSPEDTDQNSSSERSTEIQSPVDIENYDYESSHSTKLSEIRRQILAPVLLNHQEEQIRKVGLIALKASDDAYLANNNDDGHIYLEIGKIMADLITDFVPITSVPKDLYRLILGKDFLTGRDLAPWERTLAAFGVVTIGAGAIVANVARDALNIARNFGTEANIAEEILRPRGFPNILSKIDNKVATYSAEEINSTIHSAKWPPYKPGTRVYEIKTKEPVTGVFARVYNNETYKTGNWIVEKGLIDGKSPREVKDILALPMEPTHIVDVDLPAEVTLRKGILNKNFGSTGSRPTLQYEIAEEKLPDPKSLKNYFRNPRGLK